MAARAKVHVRQGDTVLVIAGKDRGKRGKVERVYPATGRVLVEGVNVIKRHQRPTRQAMQGGIIERESPIHASNVMLVCPSCNAPTRIARRTLQSGKRVRVCKHCNETI